MNKRVEQFRLAFSGLQLKTDLQCALMMSVAAPVGSQKATCALKHNAAQCCKSHIKVAMCLMTSDGNLRAYWPNLQAGVLLMRLFCRCATHVRNTNCLRKVSRPDC